MWPPGVCALWSVAVRVAVRLPYHVGPSRDPCNESCLFPGHVWGRKEDRDERPPAVGSAFSVDLTAEKPRGAADTCGHCVCQTGHHLLNAGLLCQAALLAETHSRLGLPTAAPARPAQRIVLSLSRCPRPSSLHLALLGHPVQWAGVPTGMGKGLGNVSQPPQEGARLSAPVPPSVSQLPPARPTCCHWCVSLMSMGPSGLQTLSLTRSPGWRVFLKAERHLLLLLTSIVPVTTASPAL